jgi:hypothetical protein
MKVKVKVRVRESVNVKVSGNAKMKRNEINKPVNQREISSHLASLAFYRSNKANW